MEEDYEISQEEAEEMGEEYMQSFSPGYPKPREKNTVIEFLNKVFKTKNSTRVSFMNDDEVFAARILLRGSLYASINFGYDGLITNYLRGRTEIVTSPTLGRGGNLVNAAITTKKEFQAKLKAKQNKGWFKSKGGQQVE